MFAVKSFRSNSNFLIFIRQLAVAKTQAGPSGTALKLGGGVTKKGGAIATNVSMQQTIEAETDPEKLVKYCCGLNFKKDQNLVEIKDDSSYPEWLFGLEKLDQIDLDKLNKDTWEYWNRYNEEGEEYLRRIRENRFPERYIPVWLRELKPFY